MGFWQDSQARFGYPLSFICFAHTQNSGWEWGNLGQRRIGERPLGLAVLGTRPAPVGDFDTQAASDWI